MDLAGNTVAGIDEAGRGPLAGPVVAAAVILRHRQSIPGVADSKMLTAGQRVEAARRIRGEALAWALGVASRAEIDELNIYHATMLAMQRAFAGLGCPPDCVEVDGNRAPLFAGYAGTVTTIVEGDRLRQAIGAASILAKVHRDGLMTEIHDRYPGYGFAQHKGYATPAHRAALTMLGPCPEHRRSFAPVRKALMLTCSAWGGMS